MSNLLASAYLWIKTVHILAMVAWMAGLFYLPRIYVYHAERANTPGPQSETFKVMELKLYRLIMNPSMMVTWLFGLLLLGVPGLIAWGSDAWIYVKIVAVIAMTVFHVWLGGRLKDFAQDGNTRSGRHFRLMNEVPTLLLLLIVTMVVVKPF